MSVSYESNRLCKVFHSLRGRQVAAVNELTFSVPANSFLVLSGPSGSGKSTLLALLGGMERPTGGELSFDGQPMQAVSDVQLARLRRRIGFVFQDLALITKLSAMENITYPLIARGIPRRAREARARQLLERMNILELADSPAGELSGGERQRLAIARALAGEPDVLLADEPTASLDATIAASVVSTIRDFHNSGRTVIIATHDERFRNDATMSMVLEHGKIVVDR